MIDQRGVGLVKLESSLCSQVPDCLANIRRSRHEQIASRVHETANFFGREGTTEVWRLKIIF